MDKKWIGIIGLIIGILLVIIPIIWSSLFPPPMYLVPPKPTVLDTIWNILQLLGSLVVIPLSLLYLVYLKKKYSIIALVISAIIVFGPLLFILTTIVNYCVERQRADPGYQCILFAEILQAISIWLLLASAWVLLLICSAYFFHKERSLKKSRKGA